MMLKEIFQLARELSKRHAKYYLNLWLQVIIKRHLCNPGMPWKEKISVAELSSKFLHILVVGINIVSY